MSATGLDLRSYLKSNQGKQLSLVWGFKSFDYVNVVYEKVRWFIES
jgi:hypothetical protein